MVLWSNKSSFVQYLVQILRCLWRFDDCQKMKSNCCHLLPLSESSFKTGTGQNKNTFSRKNSNAEDLFVYVIPLFANFLRYHVLCDDSIWYPFIGHLFDVTWYTKQRTGLVEHRKWEEKVITFSNYWIHLKLVLCSLRLLFINSS